MINHTIFILYCNLPDLSSSGWPVSLVPPYRIDPDVTHIPGPGDAHWLEDLPVAIPRGLQGQPLIPMIRDCVDMAVPGDPVWDHECRFARNLRRLDLDPCGFEFHRPSLFIRWVAGKQQKSPTHDGRGCWAVNHHRLVTQQGDEPVAHMRKG
jgi:hypothetical protein